MVTLYKVLDTDGRPFHGGTGTWHLPKGSRPGKWMPAIPDPIPCVRGYHVCDGPADVLHWLGPVIYEVEVRGTQIRHDCKTVAEQARLVRRVDGWNERTAWMFAADCAEAVLPIFERERPEDDRPRKAIEAARAYARGEIGDAAKAAAGAAAWDAAGAADWAAGWDAGAAGWDAAGAAARAAQADLLGRYLTGELT